MTTSFKLRNGSILLSTEAPGGIYNSAQLKKIAALSDQDAAIVKVTEDQRLALFVKEDKAAWIAEELKGVGLGIRHYQAGLHQPTACIGELCPDFKQDALGSALQLSEELANLKLEASLRIGINGCDRCCVPCHTLDIAMVGDEGGYKINLGGKNTQIPEMATFMAEGVPEAELPRLVRGVIELYKKHAEKDESLQEVMERIGTSPFADILKPYSQDAAAGSDDLFGGLSEPEASQADDESALASQDESLGDLSFAPGGEGDEDLLLEDGHELSPEEAPQASDEPLLLIEDDTIASSNEEPLMEVASDEPADDFASIAEVSDAEFGAIEDEELSVGGMDTEPLNANAAGIDDAAGMGMDDALGNDELEVSSMALEGADDEEELIAEPLHEHDDSTLLAEGGLDEDLSLPEAQDDEALLLADDAEEDLSLQATAPLSQDDEELELSDLNALRGGDEFPPAADDSSTASYTQVKKPTLHAAEIDAIDESSLPDVTEGRAASVADDIENLDLGPTVVDEDLLGEAEVSEQELEEKLAEDIAHSRAIHTEDDNLEDRQAAMSLLEGDDTLAGHDEAAADEDMPRATRRPLSVAPAKHGAPAQGIGPFAGCHMAAGGALVLTFEGGAALEVQASMLTTGSRTLRIGEHTLTLSQEAGQLQIEMDDGLKMTLPAAA